MHQAGECVQDAGCLPAIQVETLGNVFGYRSGGNNGDGVVCRTEVGDADKCGDAQFRSSFAFYMARQAGDNEVDSAIVADRFQHTAGKQGDDNQFTHSCDAAFREDTRVALYVTPVWFILLFIGYRFVDRGNRAGGAKVVDAVKATANR